MPSKITTCNRNRPTRSSEGRGATARRAAVRALVESLAREMHLPRGVPSAPGQPGHIAWRAARERLLHHQLDMLAEEARERGESLADLNQSGRPARRGREGFGGAARRAAGRAATVWGVCQMPSEPA